MTLSATQASSGITSLTSVVLSAPSSLSKSSVKMFWSTDPALGVDTLVEHVAAVALVDETDIISSHGHGQ